MGKLQEEGEEDMAVTWGICGRGSQIWQLDSRQLRATSLVAVTSKAAADKHRDGIEGRAGRAGRAELGKRCKSPSHQDTVEKPR